MATNGSPILEGVEVCTRKCVKDPAQQPSLLQRSCFQRCTIKYSEAVSFAATVLRFQNLTIAKHQKMEQQRASQPGFWQKLTEAFKGNS